MSRPKPGLIVLILVCQHIQSVVLINLVPKVLESNNNFNCGLILKCQINSLAPLVYYNFSHTELLRWSSSSKTCNSPKGSFIIKYSVFMYITTNKNYCFWTILLGYFVAIHNNIFRIYYINIDLIRIHCFQIKS